MANLSPGQNPALCYCGVEHHFHRLLCFAVQCAALPVAAPQVSNDYAFGAEPRVVLPAQYAPAAL